MKTTKHKRRPAEGWPKGWYYCGEFDTVNLDALLAPDEFFNRVILERSQTTPRREDAPSLSDQHQADPRPLDRSIE